MALKLILQDAATLNGAYQERKAEYDILRAGERWAGAVLHAGTLLELALKLVICKHLGVSKLPTIFQVHDLDLLLYCSGQESRFVNDANFRKNFSLIADEWSMALRYEGATKTQSDSDRFDNALFDSSHGVIPILSQYF